ncbi:medium-chain fatty acid-CoA ligase faa2 [Coemansia spiralis]|uniref:Medium-chain fatty acid-CoA ligase faa2 n=1 Tax=Coemansia spiralis TaxID=417178 RepID=A0A9W8L5M0_9FUNG|nr:medium-chain fatty acid-CoA ligase faa2 [Coemansia spiralis]
MATQTFKVPSSEIPGYSAIYRNSYFKDGTQGSEFAEITTAYELLQHHLALAPKTEFLGTRKFNPNNGSFGAYEWQTTTSVAEYVEDFGSGLDHVFAKYAPDSARVSGQQPLGIFSSNRAEWLLAEFSAFRSRRYSVGVCDSVGVDYSEYIINHAQLTVVVASMDKIPRMLDRLAITPGLRVIISMDRLDCSRINSVTQAFCAETADVQLRKRAADAGITLLDMDEVLEMGRASPTTAQPPAPSDMCTMCYSSGTTGAQKGVLINHDGFINAVRGVHLALRLTKSTYLSFMSLAHCMDRYGIYMLMFGGARIGFFGGDKTRIVDDIQELRPTVLFAFPLLLNMIHERMAKATTGAGGIKGLLSRVALRSKQKRISSTGKLSHGLWDRVLFNKVAAKLGGRIKAILCGGMSVNPEVMDFFRAALSCEVLQGYGQTETMASGTAQRMGDFTAGHIGIPNPGIEIRLRSKPEFGYLVTDSPCPRGEMMLRSKSVFAEYLGEPEKTQNTMDGDWLATGDIVQINPTGTIKFISRTTNHLKIGAGYWISNERLENIYTEHPLVQSVYVDGHEDYYKIVAVVVPTASEFLPWARVVADLPTASLEDLCANPTVVQELRQKLRMHAEANGLAVQEQIGAIYIEPMPFRERNCALYTSTLKLKRREAAKFYDEQLKKLFAEVGKFDTPNTMQAVVTASK